MDSDGWRLSVHGVHGMATGVKWNDELGEVPEELERYFNEAPIIRTVPKSPFGNTPGNNVNSGLAPQGKIVRKQ